MLYRHCRIFFIGTRGNKDVNMHVWDAKTGDIGATYKTLPINGLVWSPDDTHIATASTNNIAQVWCV